MRQSLDGPYLNSDEAAAYCGYRGGGQVMRNHKYKGTGPTVQKLGRILVYRKEDLDSWIEAQFRASKNTQGASS